MAWDCFNWRRYPTIRLEGLRKTTKSPSKPWFGFRTSLTRSRNAIYWVATFGEITFNTLITFVYGFDGESVSKMMFKQKLMLQENVVLVSTHATACHLRSRMTYNALSVRRSGVPQFCVLSKQVFREYVTDMPASRITLSHGQEVLVHRRML
jgi:hypothetical protein